MKYNRPLTTAGAAAGIFFLAACTPESPNETPATSESPAISSSVPAPAVCDSYGRLSTFEVITSDEGAVVLRIGSLEDAADCVDMYDETTLETNYYLPVGSIVQYVCLRPDQPARLYGSVYKGEDAAAEGAIPLSDDGLHLAKAIGMITCANPSEPGTISASLTVVP